MKLIVCLLLVVGIHAQAQEDVTPEPTIDASSYDSELSKGTDKNLLEQELNKGNPEQSNAAAQDATKLNKISELEKLVPFKDIAVIQKRFLPKTGRFEFYPNIGMVTNNAFFFSAILQARLAYNLSEKWTVEATGSFFTNSKYKVTKDLKEKETPPVDTESHILTKSYYGLDLRWSPIYGKMGMFNNGILPFDMYFSFGAGMFRTNQDTSPTALHLGTGQIFALKKWMAFRWDLSGYFYSSDTRVANGGTAKSSESFQDIQLGVGLSFFFPDAKYR